MRIDRRVTDLYNEYDFHNDASAGRYDADAARLAWSRSVAFFDEYLKR